MASTFITAEPGGTPVTSEKRRGPGGGVIGMFDRLQTGRFKVLSNLSDWFAEKRYYHRKDGKIVKERDDLISATRYALMMLRFAETAPVYHRPRPSVQRSPWAV